MSDIQLALIVLGALIIALVIVYNWLQERKLRNEVSNDFIVPQKDVLGDDFHIDADAFMVDKELAEVDAQVKLRSTSEAPAENTPIEMLNADAPDIKVLESHMHETPAAPLSHTQQEIEAELQEEIAAALDAKETPIIQASLHEKLQASQVQLPETTHPQVDLSALLYFTNPVAAQELSLLNKAINAIGVSAQTAGQNSEGKWQALNAQSPEQFKQLVCSLQLADRGGPVAKNLLNKFQFAVEDTGLELNAHVEWQGSADPMQRAIALDQFCIEVDQMVSVHLTEGSTPIHGTKFKGLAEASGMQLKADGKFYLEHNDATLFVVIDSNNVPITAESLRNSVIKSVTFQMETPKVVNFEQVFNQMMGIAQKMASSLNAQLVDDNQRQIGDIQIEKIRQQLKVIHAAMVARGIMPGSPASVRLFS